MILAETVKTLTTQTATGLTQILEHSGFKNCFFKTATFVGITNGAEFAYRVTRADESGTSGETVSKVFVRYDAVTGYITASF
jgi:hypothetical protein